MTTEHKLRFDGGSIGNPGASAGAAVLYYPDGKMSRASRFIEHATNNVAEYEGLLCGLRLARAAGVKRLVVQGDSKLVVSQVTGEWQAKEPEMIKKLTEVKGILKDFESVELAWIPREENEDADMEVRKCLDAHVPNSQSAKGSFQDLAKLKVGGRDEYSRMKRDQLLGRMGMQADNNLEIIRAALEGAEGERDKLEVTALRWIARGLPADKAAQKVLVDLEIAKRATQGRGR